MREIRFTKGHGTQNDFVLVPDLDGAYGLAEEDVRRLADRRAGLGGDGVIRVVPTALAGVPEVADQVGAEWFMDYRNADGTAAQMCGNGTRVFVTYLLREGLVDEAVAREGFLIATRAGAKPVRLEADDQVCADLGPWRVVGGEPAARDGADATVHVEGLGGGLAGLSLDLGNPHTVVALPDRAALDAADLTVAPVVHPTPPEGTNVELVVPLHADDGRGHVAMRVYERGVGETRSCGTGAVAAALATRLWAGEGAPDAWRVDVPGGTLRVSVLGGGWLAGDHVELAGPAELVADGVVRLP